MNGRTVAALAAIGAIASTLGLGFAEGTRAPLTRVVGKSHGHSPSDRLGPARQGRTHLKLPGPGSGERWRRELPGGIELAPLIDAAGGVIAVLVTGEVVRIEPDGKPGWRRRVSCTPGAIPPVFTSDGAIALMCSDGSLQRIAADGKRMPEIQLRTDNRRSECAPLARDDGSVVLASDSELLHVGGEGVRARARFEAYERPVGGLIAFHKSVVMTLANGEIWQWQSPGAPKRLGSFGGPVERGAVLFGERALVAVVGRDRLVAFDPVSRQTTLLADGGGLDSFEGPPTHAPTGELLVTTGGGELLGIDSSAAQIRKTPLDATVLGDAGAPVSLFASSFDSRESPPLVVDPKGTVAFVRQSGRFGIVGAGERVSLLDAAVCSRPIALLPAGTGKIAVACATGTIVMWSDK